MASAVVRLMAREYRDSHKGIKRRVEPVNGLYGGLCFPLSPALPDMGVKMPPAGRRTAHKRRGSAGEYRDKGGHVGGPGGHEKPARGYPRAGTGGIQDFLAVSQITINGRSRIKRIIKRCTPFQREAPRRASAPDGRQCASGRDRRLARRVLACIV